MCLNRCYVQGTLRFKIKEKMKRELPNNAGEMTAFLNNDSIAIQHA